MLRPMVELRSTEYRERHLLHWPRPEVGSLQSGQPQRFSQGRPGGAGGFEWVLKVTGRKEGSVGWRAGELYLEGRNLSMFSTQRDRARKETEVQSQRNGRYT